MLKISVLQILLFTIHGGVEGGGALSGQYVGWSLQYAGFARLTRICGLYCARREDNCFLWIGFVRSIADYKPFYETALACMSDSAVPP